MLNKKQAFTFAELMISLVIISVITLILYPTISDLSPNNNEYLFKSTYKTITTIVSDYVNSPDKTGMETSQQGMCQLFCERLNTVTTSLANNACMDENNACTTFTTSNGMRWAFKDNYILVDVNPSNNNVMNDTNDNNTDDDFPNITNNSDSNIYAAGNNNPWTSPASNSSKGVFYTKDTITCDTFLFKIDSNGQVTPQGAVAVSHLESDD